MWALYDAYARPTLTDASMLTLRIFIASPGDVAEERRLAVETIRELEDSHLLRDRVRLQVVAWDDPAARAPMDARETPQRSVQRYAGRPADCDLTLVVLWSRLGTPLPAGIMRTDGSRFASGTVWEVEDAKAADRPVFVYRRTEKPRIELDDPQFDAKRAQFEALSRWFADVERDADGSLHAGINEYATPTEFRALLRQHLEAFIGRRLTEDSGNVAAASARAPAPAPAAAARPTVAPAPAEHRSSPPGVPARRWLAVAGAVLAAAVLLTWRLWPSPPPIGQANVPATSPSTAANDRSAMKPAPGSSAMHTTAAVPRVRLPDDPTVRFTKGHYPAAFALIDASASGGTSTHWTLSLALSMAIPDNGGDANFVDSSFRLLVDGVPRAPNNVLNDTVQRGTSKLGELIYEVPYGTQSLALRIWHFGDSADLPLVVEGAGPPRTAFAFPPGPRRVLVEGPAEVTFTRGTRVSYAVLAAGTEARRPGVMGLRIRLRMTVFDSGGGANFWDSSFRIVVDGQASAPDSNLNELVGARAAKDAEISFELPEGARTAILRIRRNDDESAEVTLRFESAR